MLLTKKGTEPVMIRPILIHQRKNFDSYFKLSSSILQICPEMKSLKVFGTDGDKNLSDAFEVCFTSAKHLLCDIHMQDNIERKLKELGIQKKEAKSYIEDIFGKISHETKIKGLVDSMSPEEFDEKLSSLQNEWKSRHSSGLSFLDYFLEHKAELIKNCMNADLRSLAGLGYPPQPYNQNANECMNAIIKGDLRKNEEGKLKMSEKDFVISLEKIVKRQETEVKLALIGKGEYRLKTEYQHLEVTEDIYWRKSVTQREAVFEKMLREPLKSKGDETVVENRPVDDAAQSLFTSYPSAESTDITNIPFPILESIFQDSKIIFQSSNGIVQMPGCDDKSAFFVLNKNQTSDPFKVHRSKCTTLFTCEMKCHRYNCYKLCEHTTATAFYCNLLTDYIQQYKKKHNSERNLTAISLTGMPRNRGKKPKGTSIRKGRNNKTFTEVMDYAVSKKSSLEQPFHLTFLAGLVNKCYGCGQQFSDKLRAPPNDLVLKRYDHRKYLSRNSKTQRVSASL
ncbi:uncharacterized protein LOC134235383 [Saccostrea cucullata]|uniref:uncharacterized protein LOC134235383 n=1 Tax=Saccostrea cuccullata TaxID=36930 RepID=UPI002ED61A17